MAYTYDQLYQLAQQQGLSGATAAIAAAIALAESNGNPLAHCFNCAGVPEDSRGLWQINVNAHPEWAQRCNLYDPACNAQAMSAISQQGANFHAWSTYTSGAFQKFTANATAIAATPGSGSGLAGAISGAMGNFSTSLVSLSQVMAGGIMVLVGILLATGWSKPVTRAAVRVGEVAVLHKGG